MAAFDPRLLHRVGGALWKPKHGLASVMVGILCRDTQSKRGEEGSKDLALQRKAIVLRSHLPEEQTDGEASQALALCPDRGGTGKQPGRSCMVK